MRLHAAIGSRSVLVVSCAALAVIFAAAHASAENISKSFEIGTAVSPRTVSRTFPVPSATAGGVAAVVKFQRLGSDGTANDVPIVIELHEPDTAPGVEGALVEAKNVIAKRAEQSVTIRSQSSNRGCSLPWRIRVRHANDGAAPVQVFGTLRMDYDGRAIYLDGNNLSPEILHAASATTTIGTSAGFGQGLIDIRANWYHIVLGMGSLGSNRQIMLRWELIDPSGTTVRTIEAYSNEDGSPTPRMILTYQVPKNAPGQWKMKIKNLHATDDVRISPAYSSRKFTPGCP